IRALNEIVLTRKSRRTLSQFDISLNSHPFTKYAADGLIFSTPTRSTAYSLSAGGPIVSPAAAVFLMNPIYPHSFFDRTIVFGEDETVEAMPSGRHDMSVSADGLLTEVPDSVDFARISCGGHLRLARAGKEDFYSILVKKLGI
ncbi:MAG: NAD(+)/NADH kinase, partial [Terriglobia bacterium]